MVVRFHRSLKSSLRARLAGSDWVPHLPLGLLGLRATPKDDTGLSVSEAVYGSPLTLPGELVDVPDYFLMPSSGKLTELLMDSPFLHLIMFVLFLQFNCLQLLCQLSMCLFVRMQLYHPWHLNLNLNFVYPLLKNV